jgi:hypothetical protein
MNIGVDLGVVCCFPILVCIVVWDCLCSCRRCTISPDLHFLHAEMFVHVITCFALLSRRSVKGGTSEDDCILILPISPPLTHRYSHHYSHQLSFLPKSICLSLPLRRPFSALT